LGKSWWLLVKLYNAEVRGRILKTPFRITLRVTEAAVTRVIELPSAASSVYYIIAPTKDHFKYQDLKFRRLWGRYRKKERKLIPRDDELLSKYRQP